MSRSRSNASRRDPSSQVPAWVWLFTGAVLGAFVMFLMHLSDVEPPLAAEKTRSSSSTSGEEKAQKPRFDFYDLLKQSDVPTETPAPVTRNSTPAQSAPAADRTEFLLQVASFRSKEDAESLRAQLILLNLNAYTEDAKIRNGETWHRVMVGPFSSTSTMSKARGILLQNRHEALVLKRAAKG